MATIAAFINGPGLGQPVVRALNALRVGDAFVPGICIVLMAIMLDRVTTAASEHGGEAVPQPVGRRGRPPQRSCCWPAAGVTRHLRLPLAALRVRGEALGVRPRRPRIATRRAERRRLDLDELVGCDHGPGRRLHLHGHRQAAVRPGRDAVVRHRPGDPRDRDDPRRLEGRHRRRHLPGVAALARAVERRDDHADRDAGRDRGGDDPRGGDRGRGWAGARRCDRIIRPVLDAGQTMPPVRLPDPGAGAVRRHPLHRDRRGDRVRRPGGHQDRRGRHQGGLARPRSRPPSRPAPSRIQIITKVQLPMARSASLVLAANQGLLYVLSMVVIGGLVGAGALGYDVVAGFTPARHRRPRPGRRHRDRAARA